MIILDAPRIHDWIDEGTCPACGLAGWHPVFLLRGTKAGHYAEMRCAACDRYIKFVGNEDARRRESKHRKLVKKFSRGFCEMCLCWEQDLPPGETLEGHHVQEHQDDGPATRDNVWILCTSCHELLNWKRRWRRKGLEPNAE